MACSKYTICDSTNDLTFDLYKYIILYRQTENVLMSSANIMVVMAILHSGARKNTEMQLVKGLRLEAIDNKALEEEIKRFVCRFEELNKRLTLQIVNSLFVNSSKSVSEDFILMSKAHFRADVQEMDFIAKAEESRQAINKWVEEKTHNKIQNIISVGTLNEFSSMVVVNAMYFKGDWKQMFKKTATAVADFHINGKESIKVNMMRETFTYVKYSARPDLGCQVIELPYMDDELGMLILLPKDKDGLAMIEENLTFKTLKDIMENMFYDEITVHLPKLKLQSSYMLSGILSALGMHDLFDSQRADLSGIAQDIYVTDVFHNTFIDVNEEGSEEETALGLRGMCNSTKFVADHPFMFMIWDHKLDVPLFFGRLVNPSL